MRKLFSRLKLLYLAIRQDQLIFKPYPKNVERMGEASEYGLDDVSDVYLTTEDGHELHLWVYRSAEFLVFQDDKSVSEEKKIEIPPPPPLVVFFHGNTGHWGDVGAPKRGEEYDRRYRIELLRACRKRGVSFCAVSMRGYGKSSPVLPSEQGFEKDIRSLVDYLLEEQRITRGQLILVGESLGASVAVRCAVTLTQRGCEPEKLVTIAAFSSMYNKVLDLHPDLHNQPLANVIRHPFDSEKAIRSLVSTTRYYAFYPEYDESTDSYHSEKLHVSAKKSGLESRLIELPEASHIVWDVEQIMDEILAEDVI